MRFSRRLPQDLSPTDLSQRLTAAQGVVDLTESNPTRCGFCYPTQELSAIWSRLDTAKYEPHPLGLEVARQAVAEYMSRADRAVQADRVVLTASTSEAYSLLLKLWCDPGDRVAVPAPSYPLVDVLAELEWVRTCRYRLCYRDRWQVDPESLRASLEPPVRFVVTVQPNNPTGSCLDVDEVRMLRRECLERDLPILSDEVFGPYGPDDSLARGLGEPDGPLTCVLDGLSKAAGMPQLKLSWIVLSGSEAAVAATRTRLEWLADTYLSVGTPVQLAAPELLRLAADVQAQIRARVVANRQALVHALGQLPGVEVLAADGGWYAVLRVPAARSEESMVIDLAEHDRVVVHPGYFYDFAEDGYLVMGLLLPPATFNQGLERVGNGLARWCR